MKSKLITSFWHNPDTPRVVEDITESFKSGWPDYEYSLYNDDTAVKFIRDNYGWEVSRLYESCRIPAMRSDLFRVLSLYLTGGVWVDVKFLPRAQPDIIIDNLPCGGLTVCRWFHGRVVNGVFFCSEGSSILYEIINKCLLNIKEKKGDNIFLVTGPGVWNEVLAKFVNGVDYNVINHDELFSSYLKKQKFELSGRGGAAHWSVAQKTEGLFFPS